MAKVSGDMKIVISNFYNEEYLLEFWLQHNKNFFDYGILIDYHSTDNSVNLIKKICPTWEIRTASSEFFQAQQNTEDTMTLERETFDRFPGRWVTILNTTEFIFGDLDSIIQSNQSQAYSCRGVYMVDPPELMWQYPDPNLPLLQQRYYGYYEREACITGCIARERLLHCHRDGAYHIGRHVSNHPSIQANLLCCWYGFSPFVEELLNRKTQIQTKIPQFDKDRGIGWGHLMAKEQFLEGQFGITEYQKYTRDMRTDPIFGELWNKYYV